MSHWCGADRNGDGITTRTAGGEGADRHICSNARIEIFANSTLGPLARTRHRHLRPTVSYFEHNYETRIARHAVGTYHYTVVYLDPSLHAALPLDRHSRLRIEADVSGVPVKGA